MLLKVIPLLMLVCIGDDDLDMHVSPALRSLAHLLPFQTFRTSYLLLENRCVVQPAASGVFCNHVSGTPDPHARSWRHYQPSAGANESSQNCRFTRHPAGVAAYADVHVGTGYAVATDRHMHTALWIPWLADFCCRTAGPNHADLCDGEPDDDSRPLFVAGKGSFVPSVQGGMHPRFGRCFYPRSKGS